MENERIKVGDEVKIIHDGCIGVVTYVYHYNGMDGIASYVCFLVLTGDGNYRLTGPDTVHKTGKVYEELIFLLNEMKLRKEVIFTEDD